MPELQRSFTGVNRQLPKGRVDEVDDSLARGIDEVDGENVEKLTRAAKGRDLCPLRVGVPPTGQQGRYTLVAFLS